VPGERGVRHGVFLFAWDPPAVTAGRQVGGTGPESSHPQQPFDLGPTAKIEPHVRAVTSLFGH
jgi:hypothetical protein